MMYELGLSVSYFRTLQLDNQLQVLSVNEHKVWCAQLSCGIVYLLLML